MTYLNVPAAADRVGRSTVTIRRWIATRRLPSTHGLVRECDLIEAERTARRARNTPRGITAGQRPSDNVRV